MKQNQLHIKNDFISRKWLNNSKMYLLNPNVADM